VDNAPTIVVRHCHTHWEVFDLQGRAHRYNWRAVAIGAAYELLRDQPGIIQIFDGDSRLMESVDLRDHDADKHSAYFSSQTR
jgi:hypothetical protein